MGYFHILPLVESNGGAKLFQLQPSAVTMVSVSINSRRSGGGDQNDAAMTWWKYLLLASLLLLVGFLVRLNLQLLQEIGRSAAHGDAAANAVAAAAMSMEVGRSGQPSSQKRLMSLRKQVSGLKEKVVTMRGMIKEIEEQKHVAATPPSRR